MIRVQILLDRERCISGHISETLRPPDQETGEYTLIGKDKYLIDTATTIPGTATKWVYWLFHCPPSKQTMRSKWFPRKFSSVFLTWYSLWCIRTARIFESHVWTLPVLVSVWVHASVSTFVVLLSPCHFNEETGVTAFRCPRCRRMDTLLAAEPFHRFHAINEHLNSYYPLWGCAATSTVGPDSRISYVVSFPPSFPLSYSRRS